MHTIVYRPNGLSQQVILRFYGAWRRMRYTSASVYHKHYKYDESDPKMVVDTYYMKSYASPIIYAAIITDYDKKWKQVHFYVNKELWNCSRTTIQHVSKFVKDLAEGHKLTDVDYWMFKSTMKSKVAQENHVAQMFDRVLKSERGYAYTVLVSPCDNVTMCRLFEDTPTMTAEFVG